MASLLRQIVAGPRARHPEAGLDLCYVTDDIIATSGPSGTYPQLAYRNPLKQLVKFLDEKHGDQWAIWEFRAEGTGYPDSEVYNRIYHYPWPDHHPPPFALIPLIMGSMRNWLKGDSEHTLGDTENGLDQKELVRRLSAVQIQQDGLEPPPSLDKDNSTNTGSPQLPLFEFSNTNTHALHDPTDHVGLEEHETKTVDTSATNSGASTPNSARRRKEVRWRESTILPVKTSQSNGKPAKDAKSKMQKRGATKTSSGRVIVVHCKAGKGRSGTVSCSYLISEEGWTVEKALQRFTERRMKPGFGAGVSIPSQLRWISYVDRWTKGGKLSTERPVEIVEVHVWGLRDRVKVAVAGFKDEGRKIVTAHTFAKEEKEVVRSDGAMKGPGFAGAVTDVLVQERERHTNNAADSGRGEAAPAFAAQEEKRSTTDESVADGPKGDAVLRPKDRIILETGDVNIDFERRNKGVSGLTMVTSVAHVWFNAFFEGQGPEREGRPLDSGVFEIEWDKMDGLKGSSRKGIRAFDRLAVVWKVDLASDKARQVDVPLTGIKDQPAADWKSGEHQGDRRELGPTVDSEGHSEVTSGGSTPSMPSSGK